MGKHYLPKTMLICIIVFFMMPVWAVDPLDCNDSTRINEADIKNKITIRAGQIGIAHAWTKFGEESSMPDIYLNGCALNVRDAGSFMSTLSVWSAWQMKTLLFFGARINPRLVLMHTACLLSSPMAAQGNPIIFRNAAINCN